MADDNIDQLYEMVLAAKPYLRASLEKMRASIDSMENESARKGFGDFLRGVLVADHSEAIKLINSQENP
jgi:hypothetical protein